MIFNRSLRRLFLALCGSVLLSACAGEDAVAEGGRKPVDLGTPEDTIVLGMGCFWGAEKRMSEMPGVIDVESGYANGDIEGSYRGRRSPTSARCAGARRASATMRKWSR